MTPTAKASITFHQKLSCWFITLIIIGYPIAGIISSGLNIQSTYTSIPYRLIVLAASAIVFFTNPKHRTLKPTLLLLGIFLFLYLIRLAWDTAVADIPQATSASIFYAITVLAPCVAIPFTSRHLSSPQSIRYLAKSIQYIGVLTCAAALPYAATILLTQESTTERLTLEALNPISLGHLAVTTIIAALYLMTAHKRSIASLTGSLSSATVSFLCLILTGSRGPLLALGIVAVAIIARSRSRLLLLLIITPLSILFFATNNPITNRFSNIGDERSANYRIEIQTRSFDQFSQSPLLGSSFIERESGAYAHNLFIDTLLSTGLVGTTSLLLLIAVTIQPLRRCLASRQSFIALLFVQYFIGAQLSGSIYGNSALWCLWAAVLSLNYNSIKRNDNRSKHLTQ